MLNRPEYSSIMRILVGIRQWHGNHPGADRIEAAVYACFALAFLLVGRVAFNLAAGVLIADAIGLAAIGLSGRALRRSSKAQLAPAAVSPPLIISAGAQETSEAAEEQAAASLAAELFSSSQELGTAKAPAKAPPGKLIFKREPIVTIPQRKIAVIAGEIVNEDGSIVAASEELAEVDELRLAHALAFATKNKAGIGRTIMVRLAVESLDGRIVDELVDLITAAPELKDRIVFELPPESLDTPDERLISTLQGYRGLGVQFAAQKETAFEVSDFLSHARLWGAFSYILMPAKLILDTLPDVIALVDTLGPRIVALNVSSNEELLEVLDYQVPLAAGPHFARAPRSAAEPLPAVQEKKKKARRPERPSGQAAVEPPREAKAASRKQSGAKPQDQAHPRSPVASSRAKSRRPSPKEKEQA